MSFVRKKLTKNLEKVDFWGFYTIWLLDFTSNLRFNALKIRLSFVKKPKTPSKSFFFGNLKRWGMAHSKNLGRHVFFDQIFCFRGCFWFFWRRHNLIKSTVFQLWCYFTTSNKKKLTINNIFLENFTCTFTFFYFFSIIE